MQTLLRRLAFAGAVTAAAGFAATATIAQKLPNPMDFGVMYEMLAFEAADTDGNNLVSEAEFVRDAAAAFAGLDRNRDGKLTPEELGPHDPKLFARVDANRDGVLTFDEVMAYKMTAFRAADVDKDGALSFDEMVRAVRSELETSK